MAGRRRAHEEEHENHERWIVTYADMITLLMAFFVMMYGMSILDLKKFAEFKAGAAKQLGKAPVLPGGTGILLGGQGVAEAAAPPIGNGPRNGSSDSSEVTGEVTRERLGDLVREVNRRLEQAGLATATDVEIEPRGLVVYVRDRVLFRSGEAFLEPEGRRVLDQLAVVLAHIDNAIVVEGHTDDVPIRGGGRFPTNWELSTARATQVLRWLVEVRGLPAARFSAAGYADTHPRVPNDSAQHRALNRRVEIVILTPDGALTPEVLQAAGPSGPAAPEIRPLAADTELRGTGQADG